MTRDEEGFFFFVCGIRVLFLVFEVNEELSCPLLERAHFVAGTQDAPLSKLLFDQVMIVGKASLRLGRAEQSLSFQIAKSAASTTKLGASVLLKRSALAMAKSRGN